MKQSQMDKDTLTKKATPTNNMLNRQYLLDLTFEAPVT